MLERKCRRLIFPALALLTFFAAAGQAQTSVTLVLVEGYGTIHAGGVVATISGDSNDNATAALEWRRTGDPSFLPGHDLARIDATHFAGSLFWLDPNTSYDVRVTVSDPNGVSGNPTQSSSLTTRATVSPEPTTRTVYVDPLGSDAPGNDGTNPGNPLQTIQRAADLAQPGDLILIGPGTYRESVTVPASGTAAQPIVFRGQGSGAILDGADAAIAGGIPWLSGGSGVYYRNIAFATGHVVTDQGRLFRYDSLGELQALGAGYPGGFFYDSGLGRLYVKLNSGSPANRTMHVASLENGFYLDSRSHVRIENLEIRHYGSGDYGKGVYLRYSFDCAVRLCRIHEIGSAGVWIKGGERNLVERNQFWDTSIFGWPWPYTKGSSAENNAVALTNDVGRGNVIRRNSVRGFFNGVGPCGGEAPPSGITVETDVYDNSFFEHTDDALEPEGYCSNVRLWGNTIEDVHMAFAVAPAAPGPTYILRNIAYNFGNTRTSQQDGYTASALKINSGYPTPIGPLYLYHNTFLTETPSTDAMNLLNPGESTWITARNNIFAGTRYALSKVNPVTLYWDWDDLYTTDPTRLVYWEGSHYTTLPAFQSGESQELNGLSEPPALRLPAAGYFEPLSASPLVDRGIAISGINDGYLGSAPDIGARERGDLPFRDGFETGDTTAWSDTLP